MSGEAITALGWVSSSSTDRYPTEQQYSYLDSSNASLQGAFLSEVSLVVEGSDPGMNVQRVYSGLLDGMQNGFMGASMKEMLEMLKEAGKPNSNVSPADLQGTLIMAASSMAMAEIASRLGSKTTEVLQTLVVKQA